MSAAKKGDYYRVKVDFGKQIDGEWMTFHTGELINSGSPIFKKLGNAAGEHLELATTFGRWDVEAATAGPGEKRGE